MPPAFATEARVLHSHRAISTDHGNLEGPTKACFGESNSLAMPTGERVLFDRAFTWSIDDAIAFGLEQGLVLSATPGANRAIVVHIADVPDVHVLRRDAGPGLDKLRQRKALGLTVVVMLLTGLGPHCKLLTSNMKWIRGVGPGFVTE